jgi:transposase
VKALACDRPRDVGLPLARFSVDDVACRAWEAGIRMSYSTVWRLLHQDALRPWFQKQWLFPKDPRLLEKARPVLELYHYRWQGEPLGPRDLVLCADELTNLRPLARHHATMPPGPDREGRYEFSHDRQPETRCYRALLEVFTGHVYGEVGEENTSAAFDALVHHYLRSSRVAAAERIFLIVDNGSAHHPNTSPARLAALDPRVTVVNLPTHSSWLNQIEIYFSILKRKALTPLDLPDALALTERIYGFQRYYNEHAEPFTWKYTVADLARYLKRLIDTRQWPPPPKATAPARGNPLTLQ